MLPDHHEPSVERQPTELDACQLSQAESAPQKYRLSRFVSVRRDGGAVIAESVLTGHTLRIKTASVLKLLLFFVTPQSVESVVNALDPQRRQAVRAFLQRCTSSAFLVPVDEGGRAEDEVGSLAHWEFADLLFHVRGRLGRGSAPWGATYHLRGVVPPEPAVLQRAARARIDLYRPNLAQLARSDMTLTEALESRRTVYSVANVSVGSLGEFLFRTCRVTGWKRGEGGGEYALKVHPSGGALHPMELYIAAAGCTGLSPGMYRYDAVNHGLVPVSEFTADVEALLRHAQQGTAGRLAGPPPVLLVLAARFRRTAFKYQAIAYRVILQEVGTIFQTMYLVASSMKLAPAAIGIGDSDLFARIAGTDYYRETSVGEFILGGSPDAQER